MTDPNAPGRLAAVILGSIGRHEAAGRDVGATPFLKDVLGAVAAHVPGPERRAHRCDESCTCPGDGLPMFYAPSTGRHACQDPDCAYAHPER